MDPTFLAILVILLLFLWFYITNNSSFFSAPFVPTEPKVVSRMLDIAEIKKGDTLYDLGSGDGRIVVSGALRGANSVGVEMDPIKVLYSRLFIKAMRLNKTAKIIGKDLFQVNLKDADVITLFLLQDTNQKLKDKFKKELKKGTKIISYAFTLEDMKPEKTYLNTDTNFGPIYLYKIK